MIDIFLIGDWSLFEECEDITIDLSRAFYFFASLPMTLID